ncbi:MAG TPA: hypothetical protein VHC49_03095 [Mycobacteriales bacterium]|nr:hypothetical protein [Mycobacteriales bacterium]
MMKVPTPIDALRLAEQSRKALLDAIALVPRLVAVVGQVEQLMMRVEAIVTAVEDVQRRAAHTVTDTQALLDRVDPIFLRYEASLTQLAPVIQRLAETTDPREVDAMVTLVDQLPEIVAKVDSDILPILNTLNTVAPDLRELLDSSKELRRDHRVNPRPRAKTIRREQNEEAVGITSRGSAATTRSARARPAIHRPSRTAGGADPSENPD